MNWQFASWTVCSSSRQDSTQKPPSSKTLYPFSLSPPLFILLILTTWDSSFDLMVGMKNKVIKIFLIFGILATNLTWSTFYIFSLYKKLSIKVFPLLLVMTKMIEQLLFCVLPTYWGFAYLFVYLKYYKSMHLYTIVILIFTSLNIEQHILMFICNLCTV